jgi:hypothetical protein
VCWSLSAKSKIVQYLQARLRAYLTVEYYKGLISDRLQLCQQVLDLGGSD